MTDLRYYIITFDVELQQLDDVREQTDAEAAGELYRRLADRHRDNDRIHVVLFTADSLETLKATHPHYFRESGSSTTAPFPALAP